MWTWNPEENIFKRLLLPTCGVFSCSCERWSDELCIWDSVDHDWFCNRYIRAATLLITSLLLRDVDFWEAPHHLGRSDPADLASGSTSPHQLHFMTDERDWKWKNCEEKKKKNDLKLTRLNCRGCFQILFLFLDCNLAHIQFLDLLSPQNSIFIDHYLFQKSYYFTYYWLTLPTVIITLPLL